MVGKLKSHIQKLLVWLMPFRQILWFIALFLAFDLLWKIAVGHDEMALLVFGKDLAHYTEGISIWTAKITHWVVYEIFGYHNFKIDGITIFFENSLYIDVIWGCTGLKQFFMFTFILLFYYGPIKKKLWYLPLSMFVLFLVNILRLTLLCIITKDGFPEWFIPFNEWYSNRVWDSTDTSYWLFYKDWFNLFHRDIFTWIYYDGVIFVLWLVWEEKINKPYQRLKQRQSAEEL